MTLICSFIIYLWTMISCQGQCPIDHHEWWLNWTYYQQNNSLFLKALLLPRFSFSEDYFHISGELLAAIEESLGYISTIKTDEIFTTVWQLVIYFELLLWYCRRTTLKIKFKSEIKVQKNLFINDLMNTEREGGQKKNKGSWEENTL